MKRFTFVMCMLLPLTCFGQIDTLWTRVWPSNDYNPADDIVSTPDGGYIVVGQKPGQGEENAWYAKADSSGSLIWSRVRNGPHDGRWFSIDTTYDGGYILGGYTYTDGITSDDATLLKITRNADTVWVHSYPEAMLDRIQDLTATMDRGYLFVGGFNSDGWSSCSLGVFKVDSIGTLEWSRKFSPRLWSEAYAAKETPDSGFIVAGYTSPWGDDIHDAYLLKFNRQGDTLWTRAYSSYDLAAFFDLVVLPDGSCVATGISSFYSGPRQSDVLLMKISGNGTQIWRQTYGGFDYDAGNSLIQIANNGFLIAGWTYSYGPGYENYGCTDLYLVETDSSGLETWENAYGGAFDDRAYSIHSTIDGGFIVSGYSCYDSWSISQNAYLLKAYTELTPVTGVAASDSLCDSVLVSWIDTGGEALYHVFRDSVLAGWVFQDSVRFWDHPSPGIHQYQIRPVNAASPNCPLSEPVSGQVLSLARASALPETLSTADSCHIILTHCDGVSVDSIFLSLTHSFSAVLAVFAPVRDTLVIAFPDTIRMDYHHARFMIISCQGGERTDTTFTRTFYLSANPSIVPEPALRIPTNYSLFQNNPNPFNPTTTITFDLAHAGYTSLRVYNVMGQEIAILVDGGLEAGRHHVTFDATNLSSGLYFCRIAVNGYTAQKKMLLVR